MCTLAVMKNAFPGYPLVVAANRDEQFSRPAMAPTLKTAPCKILSPTDLERGGTWIGINEYGVLVALTNRRGIRSIRGLRSRGELVSEALKQPTALQALSSVIQRAPGEHNACHMVIVDPGEGYTLVGNGVGGSDVDGHDLNPGFSYAPLSDGLTIVTNLGMGTGTPRGNAIKRAWDQLRSGGLPPPRYATFAPMLNWHAGEQPSGGPHGRRYGETCLHPTQDDPDYGTVSSAVIRLSDTYGGAPRVWHYWHGARQKTSPAHCATAWSEMMILPIRVT
jgi:hypothetical protein